MENELVNKRPFGKPNRQSSPIISNEDLVVLAATPLGNTGLLGGLSACLGTAGPPAVLATSAISSAPRHRNGAVSNPTSAGTMCSSDSQLSIQIASPVPANERVGPNFTAQSDGEQQGTAAPRVEIIRRHCFNERVRKTACGLLVTAGIATSWVGATHFVKRTYLYRDGATNTNTSYYVSKTSFKDSVYYAPFFTTWFCTIWTGLFFPLYLITRFLFHSEKTSFRSMYKESVRTFRDKGFTASKFFTRSSLFCLLWVATNYMYIHALRILDATDVMVLYSSNVSFIYLLSWVILHEQFVGVRIVAVILCNTGIALLAYMDGLTKTPTLGGVILGAAASAGSAVFKVLFKKMIGEASFNQVAFFFTVISLFNTFLLWPAVLTLYFTRLEIMKWSHIPWIDLVGAAGLSLVTNLLGNFGIAVTYEIFITLGLVVAVPLSAALDIRLYNVEFVGMKLSGVILIVTGFMLVLTPENWPDFLTKIIHLRRRPPPEEPPTRQDGSGGGTRSRLRSPSGLIK